MAAETSTYSGSPRKASSATLSGWAAQAVAWLLIGVIAYITAQAVWFVAYGDAVRPLDLDARTTDGGGAASRVTDLSILSEVSLFETRGDIDVTAPQVVPETRLNLSLTGVRAGGEPREGAAFIQAPNTGQRAFAPGDEIAPGVTLEEIYGDRVIINRSGARESLFISEEAAARARAGVTPTITAQRQASSQPTAVTGASPLSGQPDLELARSLDVEDWVEGLRLAPRMVDGQVTGLRVRPNAHLEVLRAAGLQVGDVLTEINGEPVSSLEAAQRALASLDRQDRLFLSLERNGGTVDIDVPLN